MYIADSNVLEMSLACCLVSTVMIRTVEEGAGGSTHAMLGHENIMQQHNNIIIIIQLHI